MILHYTYTLLHYNTLDYTYNDTWNYIKTTLHNTTLH